MPGLRAHEAVIVVGSNVDPEANVRRAVALVGARFALRAASSVYRSPAVGGDGPRPDFLNLALLVATDCPPRALREACRRLEERAGRVRSDDRYAPRTLDLDVVLLDAVVADYGDWRLPDPDLSRRAFVLVPAAEVAPARVHPETGLTLAAMARARSVAERASLTALALDPRRASRSAARSSPGPASR